MPDMENFTTALVEKHQWHVAQSKYHADKAHEIAGFMTDVNLHDYTEENEGGGEVAEEESRTNKAWTSEDDALLTQMWNDGAKRSDIAAALGRNGTAISARRSTIGLPTRGEFPGKKEVA